MKKYLSFTDLVVIIVTFALFGIALGTQGITHDLLIESGILLVSIKLIMMNYKSILNFKKVMNELNNIKEEIQNIKKEDK